MEASALLCKLLLQDIERRPDGVAVREGVSQERIVSVHDPEMRYGRKSSHHRFDGHKAPRASSTARYRMLSAITASTGRCDRVSTPRVERARVMLCAAVNAVTTCTS